METKLCSIRKRSWYNPTIDLSDLVLSTLKKLSNLLGMIVPKMNKGGIILSDNVLWVVKCLNRFKKRCQHQVLLDVAKLDPK
jgi:hypothetical protein